MAADVLELYKPCQLLCWLQMPRSGTWVRVTTKPPHECGLPATTNVLCVGRMMASEGEQFMDEFDNDWHGYTDPTIAGTWR